MAKAYSLDLRRKAFAAWRPGEQSQAGVAARFWGERELRGRPGGVLHRQTGGGRVSLAITHGVEHLSGLVAARDDQPIAEHQQNMRAAGFAMSAASVGRMLLRLRQTRKKDAQGRRGWCFVMLKVLGRDVEAVCVCFQSEGF